MAARSSRVRIREEAPRDRSSVHTVNAAAFASSAEADLVDALRGKTEPQVSLVAEVGGDIVGHILFSPVELAGDEPGRHTIMGLGPMAVVPYHQRQGIGTALVREGLERCAALGCDAVVVLGHPAFYSRFGFVPASTFHITSEYDVDDDVFMAVELRPGALRRLAGKVRYDEAFGEAGGDAG